MQIKTPTPNKSLNISHKFHQLERNMQSLKSHISTLETQKQLLTELLQKKTGVSQSEIQAWLQAELNTGQANH